MMRPYSNVLIKLLLKCSSIVATGILLTTAQADWQQPELGYRLAPLTEPVVAPAFTLQDMDENDHRLADYRGKVILMNFWATWCPPCRREMPSMEKLHLDLKEANFSVIAINQMEDPDHVFAYTGQLEVDPTFTILFDQDSHVSRAYRVNGIPTTYLIDKKGVIRYRAIGGRDFNHPEVKKIILELLHE